MDQEMDGAKENPAATQTIMEMASVIEMHSASYHGSVLVLIPTGQERLSYMITSLAVATGRALVKVPPEESPIVRRHKTRILEMCNQKNT